jgi:hypothetical protein
MLRRTIDPRGAQKPDGDGLVIADLQVITATIPVGIVQEAGSPAFRDVFIPPRAPQNAAHDAVRYSSRHSSLGIMLDITGVAMQ